MTKKNTAYKIQNSKGLFSTGGVRPEFSIIGKTWSSLSYLKSHLNHVGGVTEAYSDCKVVEVQEIFLEMEDNSLQKLCEKVIVESSIRSDPYEFPEMVDLLTKFVLDGTCYSSEFKEFIIQRKALVVETLVPDYIIENFDVMHNRGIKGCSESELAAIMLTATKVQQSKFNL